MNTEFSFVNPTHTPLEHLPPPTADNFGYFLADARLAHSAPSADVKYEPTHFAPQAIPAAPPLRPSTADGARTTPAKRRRDGPSVSRPPSDVVLSQSPASRAATPSGSHDNEDGSDDEGEGVDDRRRRNTAASARFRRKKKEREQHLEFIAKEMTSRAEALQRRVLTLEAEVAYLKDLLTMKRQRESEGSDLSSPQVAPIVAQVIAQQQQLLASLSVQQQQQQQQSATATPVRSANAYRPVEATTRPPQPIQPMPSSSIPSNIL